MEMAYFGLGTLLCSLGLWTPRFESRRLLWPRVVVPGLIWATIFLPYLVGLDPYSRFLEWRVDAELEALQYACLCVACFWLGFGAPIGKWAANLLRTSPSGLVVDPERFRVPALVVACVPFAVQFGILGFAVFDARDRYIESNLLFLGPVVGRLVAVSVDLASIVGATALGYSWPRRENRSFFLVTLHVLGLLICAHSFFMRFSRGSGLVFFMAYIAASIRFRKIHWPTGVLVALVVALTAHAGLAGRDAYGHFAGSIPYFRFLFTESVFAWPDVFLVMARGADKLTPLSVVISGTQSTSINELSHTDWLLTQMPVPRIVGLPEWTADAAHITGGAYQRPFNYTLTWLGDTYAHWGFWGALFFIYPGIAYRFVDRLVSAVAPERSVVGFYAGANGRTVPVELHYLNFYSIFMVVTYGAAIRGIFNTFRSWNILFVVCTYVLIIGVVSLRLFRRPSNG